MDKERELPPCWTSFVVSSGLSLLRLHQGVGRRPLREIPVDVEDGAEAQKVDEGEGGEGGEGGRRRRT